MHREQGSSAVLTIVLLVYILAVVGYAIYGWETGTGLSGILMEYQMRFFGSASMMITFLCTMVVAAIPGVAVGALLGARMKADSAATLNAPPMATSTKWLITLVASLIIGLIPGAIYMWIEKADTEDQQRTIYQLDFRKPGPLAADAKFAQISGYKILKQQYRFSSSSSSSGSKSTKVYVPIVDAAWTPDKPVVYFYTGMITRMPDPLSVRLEAKPMPVFAKSKFEQAGVKVADQHYLLGDATIAGGKIQSTLGTYSLLPWAGLIVGFLTLLFGGIIIVGQANAAKRAAAARASAYAR
jgi:hypothetical protein